MYYYGYHLWNIPKINEQSKSALEILKMQFVAGEITREKYEEHRKVIESIITSTRNISLWNRSLSLILTVFFSILVFSLLSEHRVHLYDFLPLIFLAAFAILYILIRQRHFSGSRKGMNRHTNT